MKRAQTNRNDPLSSAVELRRHLAAHFPKSSWTRETNRPGERHLPCGVPALDLLLRGGLPLGQVCVWSGREGDGLLSLSRVALSHVLADGHRVAVVDANGSLDPRDWATLSRGRRLWIIRPSDLHQAQWAAEELGRSRVFRLVVMDLGGALSSFPMKGLQRLSVGPRLRNAARAGGASLLVLGDVSPGAMGATIALRVERIQAGVSREQRHTLKVWRTRGGPPEAQEVDFDVQERLSPRRLLARAPISDRGRPPTSRRSIQRASGADQG